MTSVTIDSQRVSAYDAVLWVSSHFGRDHVSIDHTFPGRLWHFTFKDPKQASLFALKWIK